MSAVTFPPLARGMDRLACWSAVAIGFSLPISVALDNILLALLFLGWLAGGAYAEKWGAVRRNGVALAALALFAILTIGTLYGDRHPGDALGYLGKYDDLLAIPVLVFVFRDARRREHALIALAAGLGLTLAVSYLVALGVLPQVKPLAPDVANPLAFKYKLTHNILMAFAAFLYANFAVRAVSATWRWMWLALSLLAAVNVIFLVDGLTGQLMLGVFLLYGGYLWKGWRGLAAASAIAVLTVALLAAVSEPMRARFDKLGPEFTEWRAGRVREDSSLGVRLELYRTSLAIAGDHPLLGVGTGGFPKAYAERTRDTTSRNPHNEYLLVAVQTGVVGLAALLWLFATQWRLAARLPPLEARLAHGLVLAMIVGCLFNSMLLDHTEGLLFAWLTGVLYGGLRPRPPR